MDPVTLAIVSAVTVGMVAGTTEVGKQAIIDAYGTLKALLKKKFGDESQIVKAVNEVEADPESKGRKITLEEKVAATKANEDSDILKAAQALLDHLKAQPGGEQRIQMIAQGSYIAQASHGGTASVNVNRPEDKP